MAEKEYFERDEKDNEIWSVTGVLEEGDIAIVVSKTFISVDSAVKLATALLDAAGVE